MFNYAKLYLGHFHNSKKVIFISTIGLILAITIVSSSLLYIDSSKEEIVTGVMQVNGQVGNYDVRVSMSLFNTRINSFEITKQLTNISNELINKANLNIFSNLEMTYGMSGFTTTTNSYYFDNNNSLSTVVPLNQSVVIVQLNDGIKHDLSSFINTTSVLPANNTAVQQAFALESFFDVPNSPTLKYYSSHSLLNLQNSTTLQLYDLMNQSKTYNLDISGSGKIINTFKYLPQSNAYLQSFSNPNYPALSRVWRSYGGANVYLFVNNITKFTTKIPAYQNDNLHVLDIYGGLNIDFHKIDPLVVSTRLSEIAKFADSFKTKILNTAYFQSIHVPAQSVSVQFTTQITYVMLQYATTQIYFNIMLYSIPILLVALFLSNYTFGLIHKQVVQHIGIYKTRGASRFLMLGFELVDFVLIMLIAILVGLLSGIPIASLVTKTDFLLSFNNNTSLDVFSTFVANYASLVETLFFVALLLSMIVNLRRTFKLANIQIVETENTAERADPYWKKHYLDVILFLYGTLSYLVLIYLINNQGQNISAVIIIFMYLSLPSPFAMVIGAVLLLNRLTPVLLNWIGTKLWHRSGGLLAFSFKNVIRHKQASTRAIMLIASLLTFLLLFYSIPYSQVQYNQATSIFNNGAEGVIRISNYQPDWTSMSQEIQNISSILANNFSSSLNGFSPFIEAQVNGNGPYGSNNFIFINTTTYQQASAVNHFDVRLRSGQSIGQALKELATTKDGIIINNAAFNDRFLNINDNITLTNDNSISHDFTVIDSFNMWPSTTSYTYDTNLYAITSLNTLFNSSPDFTHSIFNQINSFGFYLNFKDSVNRTAAAENISIVTGLNAFASNYIPQSYDIYSALIFQFQMGQINTNVIMSLIIAVIILIMFSYMQLNDRKREIYTELALGMKIRQTSILFFVENILLLLSGIVIGTVLGIFFVDMLAIFQTSGSQIPNYVIIMPWNLVLETYIGLIILAVLSSIIPAYYVTRQDISKSFITDA